MRGWRSERGRRWCGVVAPAVLVVTLGLTGCGAATLPTGAAGSSTARPSSSPTQTVSSAPTSSPGPTATPGPSASIPADGVTLQQYGFTNGPIDTFSVPRTAVFVTVVDQPNVVTLVLSAPTPDAVAAYLTVALPAAGYTITADDRDTKTFTFTGHGWSGSFTASGGTTAVRLSPR